MFKNKRLSKRLFAIIAISLLMIVTACMPPTATSSTATTISSIQADVVKLQQDFARKADIGQFQALEQRIIKLESTPAQTSGAYTKAETYTKAEIDKAVTDAVSALKNDQTWIKAQVAQNPASPYVYGQPAPVPTSPSGTVTMTTNPAQLPQIYSGSSNIIYNAPVGAVPAYYTVQPTGFVQPYTMRITNGSAAIQYVKPVITLSMSTGYGGGGYYYGGQYPQLIYFNINVSSGYGQVQATGTSNFCNSTPGLTFNAAQNIYICSGCTSSPAGCGLTTVPLITGTYYPIGVSPTYTSPSLSSYGNGWWVSSSTHPAPQGFPISLSPANSNVLQTPSFSFTPIAPSLNGYGEFMMTPGQTMDLLVTLQVATYQQATLQITNSISARQ